MGQGTSQAGDGNFGETAAEVECVLAEGAGVFSEVCSGDSIAKADTNFIKYSRWRTVWKSAVYREVTVVEDSACMQVGNAGSWIHVESIRDDIEKKACQTAVFVLPCICYQNKRK